MTEDSKSIEAILRKIDTDITSDKYFSYSDATAQLNRLLKEARISEMEKLWQASDSFAASLPITKSWEDYVQNRLKELKKDKI